MGLFKGQYLLLHSAFLIRGLSNPPPSIMPGPGAHFFYPLASGLVLNSLSNGRFGPHHLLFFTVNSFVGRDIGEFSQWIFKGHLRETPRQSCEWIHDPVGYMVLSLLLAFLYLGLSWALVSWPKCSWIKLHSKAPLTYIQCFLLCSAGGFTHFFLDNLFERKSKVFERVMATGDANKAVYTFPTIVVSLILTAMFVFYFWNFRSEQAQPQPPASPLSPAFAPRYDLSLELSQHNPAPLGDTSAASSTTSAPTSVPDFRSARVYAYLRSTRVYAWLRSLFPEFWCLKTYVLSSVRQLSVRMGLFLTAVATIYVGFLYLYKSKSKDQRSGIGEEADVGVIIFMAIFFVLPNLMCILAMHHA